MEHILNKIPAAVLEFLVRDQADRLAVRVVVVELAAAQTAPEGCMEAGVLKADKAVAALFA